MLLVVSFQVCMFYQVSNSKDEFICCICSVIVIFLCSYSRIIISVHSSSKLILIVMLIYNSLLSLCLRQEGRLYHKCLDLPAPGVYNRIRLPVHREQQSIFVINLAISEKISVDALLCCLSYERILLFPQSFR